MTRTLILAVCLLLAQARMAFAQTTCQFYAQNPPSITATDAQNFEQEVEIDFTNAGSTTWQNTGGVSNLSYIELRPVGTNGVPLDGPLYHSTWINRQRVGSFLAAQQGVAPQQVARFVFKVQINGAALGVGVHDCYFRPYHAQAGYINDWGMTKITVVVNAAAPAPAPSPTPMPAPVPTPNPGPTSLVSSIQSVVIERSSLRSGAGNGSYLERYDLVRSGAVALRRYQTIELAGAVSGGTAAAHEWSLNQNGSTRLLGTASTLTTASDDLFVGQQELRYRVRDTNGNWSAYALFSISVTAWPQVFLPVHGTYTRSGNDYNMGDHAGLRAVWAQDWNSVTGGNTDFGFELVASIPGTITTGQYSDGGRYANIEYATPWGDKFRAEYMHLSTVLVRDGQTVGVGQPIGLFGDTGSASQATHLHYVFSQWINGAWVSVAPEPCYIDIRTVWQAVPYNATVNSDNRHLPSSLIILPESAVSAPNRDEWGYGHGKYWASTTNATQPTASATWDTVVMPPGIWKLWMHNPSGVTNDNNGLTSHNTTASAVFEISRPRVLGYETYRVNQSSGVKGSLVEVCTMDLQAGDRLFIREHNATGESGREISFDELVLTLETPAGSGGGNNPAPSPSPSPNPMPPVSPAPPPSPAPSNPSSPTVNAPPPWTTVGGSSGGGSGGGCSIGSGREGSPLSLLSLLGMLLSIVFCRRYCSSPR